MSPIVAMSTFEAELGVRQYASTPLFEDNAGCITLAEYWHLAGRSKHIRLNLISEFIGDGILKLQRVPTTQQVADIGTKALPTSASLISMTAHYT